MNRREFLGHSAVTALSTMIGAKPSLAFAWANSGQEMTLAGKNVVPRIALRLDATDAEKYAAQELLFHLSQMTGQKIAILESNLPVEASAQAPVIVLGHHTQNRHLYPETLGVEESIVEVGKNSLHIVGGKLPPLKDATGKIFVRDRGTLYGVYNFLEQLGVRWYAPGDENTYIPTQKSLELPLGKATFKPAYRYRYGQYMWQTDNGPAAVWAVRNRMNVETGKGNPRYGGCEGISFNHTYTNLVPQWKYYKEHPEYFALIDGKRSEHAEAQLCVSNPGVQEIAAQFTIAQAKANPWRTIFSVEPNDGALWCQCENCKAWDDPNLLAYANGKPSMSNRVARFTNIIAQRLAAEVPGANIGHLTYLLHTEKPTLVKTLEPNIAIMATAFIAYSDYSKKLYDTRSAPNQLFRQILENYRGLTDQLMSYEYWGGYAWAGPLPLLTIMKDRLSQYHRDFGIIGVYNEPSYNWGPQGLNYYLYTRLMWNPALDLKKEVKEYCRHFYGPAAEPMQNYFWLLEEAGLNGPEYYSGGYCIDPLFTDELLARMKKHIDEATLRAQGQAPYQKRVRGAWTGYEIARLNTQLETYRTTHQVQKALDIWTQMEAFIKDKNNEINTTTMIYMKQPTIAALKQQLEMFKDYPDAKVAVNLDEKWSFETDPRNNGLERGVAKPNFADAQWRILSGTRWWNQQGVSYYGSAWYRKSFAFAGIAPGERALLFFGAVDGDALVYLNGKKVGERLLGPRGEGWDKPIIFDVTDFVQKGDNTLAVRVTKLSAMAGIYQGASLFVTKGKAPQ